MDYYLMKISTLVFVLFFVSCGGSQSSGLGFDNTLIIPEDSLISIIMDIHIVDAAAKQNTIPNNGNNLMKYKEYKAVFEKHGISKTRFDSTINLYTKNGKKYDEFYDKVIKKLVLLEEKQAK